MAGVRKKGQDAPKEERPKEAPKGRRVAEERKETPSKTGRRRVSHYLYDGEGLCCDACGGDFGGEAPFKVTEVPEWMLKCPCCGLRISKVGKMPQEELLDWSAGPEQRMAALEDAALTLFEVSCKLYSGRYDVQEFVDKSGEMLMLAGIEGDRVIQAARNGLEIGPDGKKQKPKRGRKGK